MQHYAYSVLFPLRAKDQLLVNWETSLKKLRTQLTQFLTQSAEDTTVKEVKEPIMHCSRLYIIIFCIFFVVGFEMSKKH